ncbi:hypothetical protein JB92DRAFT_2775699 [Gautieria morchelliformis]|nr:hypothetical protein JB92DRAFT_2775699 [Gautieria morchelliformis]
MPHIDFQSAVLNVLGAMTRSTGSIDQTMLRNLLMLTPAYLIVDNTIRSEGGIERWAAGFNRLVDVLLALHTTEQLETATVNEASKACSECWSVSGSYRELTADAREVVRGIGARLKTILDADGRKYRGECVYAP